MQKLKIRQGDWVIVCDGKKALILENAGDEKFLNLKTREVQEHADPKTSDLGTDEPGRSFSSVGSGRSAVEQTDWHRQEEERFLQKLVSQLDHSVKVGEVKSLCHCGAATGARRAASGLFPHSARRGAGGNRQGPRQASRARDRKASRGVMRFPATVMPRAGGASSGYCSTGSWAVVATPPSPAASAACSRCRTGSRRRPCRARAAP